MKTQSISCFASFLFPLALLAADAPVAEKPRPKVVKFREYADRVLYA